MALLHNDRAVLTKTKYAEYAAKNSLVTGGIVIPGKSARIKAIPHNAARADSEKNRVLMMALFRRNTLCIARKSDEIRARFFRKMPQAYCAVLR